MRNLELFSSRSVSGLPELSNIHVISVDVDTQQIYLASEISLFSLNTDNKKIDWSVDLHEEGYINPDEDGDQIISIQHLPDTQSVCLATSKGDLLLYNTTLQELECVGTVDSGLTNMCWSPDQELIILTTGEDTLIIMTREFEAVMEVSLHPDEFGEMTPMNVGWGKKETQFHGSVGKKAAIQKKDEVQPVVAWDDRKVRITWRGDGEYFATGVISPSKGCRQFRVWNREGALQCTSENVNGLEPALNWKPSGSLLASSQKLPNRHDIVFFEKNGLRHGEFTLPFKKDEVKVVEVLWNLDSTMLAIWLEELPPLEMEESRFLPMSYIQVWTVGNYHWYLKQSLHFKPAQRVTAMTFDPEPASRLHIVCNSGLYLQYTWRWTTHTSQGTTQEDPASVAVIDGNEILVTPFRHMVVPPPIGAYSLVLPTFASQVIWGPAANCNDVAVVLQDGRIAVYRGGKAGADGESSDPSVKVGAAGGNNFKTMVALPRLEAIYCIFDEEGEPLHLSNPLQIHHFAWPAPDTLVAIINGSQSASMSSLLYIDLPSSSESTNLKIRSRQQINGHIVSLAINPHHGSISAQLTGGQVIRPDGQVITKLPLTCTKIASCSLSDQDAILGLTDRYRFYINDQELASDVTSFVVHDEFLLLTTHSHTCRAISLQTDLKDLLANSKLMDENVRRVERGSRIVTVVPDDTKLILQMPRGNLETLHPRALVLSKVKKLLDNLEYANAFNVIRRHRISMNILYDHHPKKFHESTDHFVQDLDVAGNINLFLTELKDEDTTQTMYTAAYANNTAKIVNKDGVRGVSKTDVVCDALLNVLARLDEAKFLLSILTCHAKKTKPEMEIALQKISSLRTKSKAEGYPSIDEALSYILYLVDVNSLYDVALGTYDFDLVLMVAEKSQKDPKEYLPFLNNLRQLEPNYQKYSIDRHLKRYDKALQHIIKCEGRFEECLQLIHEQELYSKALALFPRESEHFKTVSECYGAHLAEKGKSSEAALVYSLGGSLSTSLELYMKHGHWQEALSVALQLKCNAQQLNQVARTLAAYLADHSRHSEAAVVYLDHCEDVEEAIVCLINGTKWQEALRLIYKYNRQDFIESNLKPALTTHAQMHLSDLESQQVNFDLYTTRLGVVRETKQQQAMEMEQGFIDGEADLYSDTSSMTGSAVGSTSSSYTQYSQFSVSTHKRAGRSAKNRRKAERRKWSLKEGSANEDMALLEALGKIIERVNQLRDDIGPLLRTLVTFDECDLAELLQQAYLNIMKHFDKTIPDIWQTRLDEDEEKQKFGPQSTTNSILASLSGVSSGDKKVNYEDLNLLIPPKINKDSGWRLKMLEDR